MAQTQHLSGSGVNARRLASERETQVVQRIIDQCGPICYAAQQGVPASFVIEMSGNRDDVHALVMNTDTVVEISLAAVKQCLEVTKSGSRRG